MKYVRFALVLVAAALWTACVTGIQDMQIANIEMSIEDEEGNRVRELLPDTVYSLDFRVRDRAGELHLNPNYRDFRFAELENLEVIQQARFSVKLRTDKSTFHPANSELYRFTLSVKGNSYPSESYSFPLNWAGFYKIDYSGLDGEEGEDGEAGLSASGESADDVEGGNGEDGTVGSRGYPGDDVTLVLSRYSYNGGQKLLLYAIGHRHLYLSELKDMVVDASGGDGGNGGRGGNGGSGRSYDDGAGTAVSGVAGEPGEGGDGGYGGDGGDIMLLAVESRLFNYIEPNSDGGDGGYGGAGGRAYVDGDLVKTAWEGRDGRDGRDGKVRYETISPQELRDYLRRIDSPGFEMKNVLY